MNQYSPLNNQQGLADYANRQMQDAFNQAQRQSSSHGQPTRGDEIKARNTLNLERWKRKYLAYLTNLDFQQHNQFAVGRRIEQ